MLRPTGYLLALLSGCLCAAPAPAQERPSRLEFTRMVAHWANYDDPGYLDFIEDAQPELAQFGFYGATFWGLAHTPQYKGYPAHFPVRGLDACGDWFERMNGELHRRDVKVIGHFNVEFLFGDPETPEGPTGFFKFYRELWDEQVLGPKPVEDPTVFLERDAEGKPIGQSRYKIGGMGEYWADLRNPHWQQVLKALVRHGIERGVDGFIVNYFYRHNALNKECQDSFRAYLKERFTPEELRERLGIENLDRHEFEELVFWHKPEESTPLRREMLRWSQISNKQVFDEIFVRYGRSLKKDLIVAQWNHLGNFSQISGDERCLLPAELWGRHEDYLWYSTGGSAYYTDLANRYLGEGTLQARYIRGAFDDRPFTLGKYEGTRIRAAIAELAANGGAPMGFYTRFRDPAAREVIVRYYQFLKRYDELYRANRPCAEAVLLYPRSRVHQGDVAAVDTFRTFGGRLLDEHVLFDVLPDDLATGERLAQYRRVYLLEGKRAYATRDLEDEPRDPPQELSRFEAPYTVRVSASRPAKGDDIALHFVNYNREEPPRGRDGKPSAGRGIRDEKPLPVKGAEVDFVVPEGLQVEAVEFLTPEDPDPQRIEFATADGRIRFELPEFLVYAVARLKVR